MFVTAVLAIGLGLPSAEAAYFLPGLARNPIPLAEKTSVSFDSQAFSPPGAAAAWDPKSPGRTRNEEMLRRTATVRGSAWRIQTQRLFHGHLSFSCNWTERGHLRLSLIEKEGQIADLEPKEERLLTQTLNQFFREHPGLLNIFQTRTLLLHLIHNHRQEIGRVAQLVESDKAVALILNDATREQGLLRESLLDELPHLLVRNQFGDRRGFNPVLEEALVWLFQFIWHPEEWARLEEKAAVHENDSLRPLFDQLEKEKSDLMRGSLRPDTAAALLRLVLKHYPEYETPFNAALANYIAGRQPRTSSHLRLVDKFSEDRSFIDFLAGELSVFWNELQTTEQKVRHLRLGRKITSGIIPRLYSREDLEAFEARREETLEEEPQPNTIYQAISLYSILWMIGGSILLITPAFWGGSWSALFPSSETLPLMTPVWGRLEISFEMQAIHVFIAAVIVKALTDFTRSYFTKRRQKTGQLYLRMVDTRQEKNPLGPVGMDQQQLFKKLGWSGLVLSGVLLAIATVRLEAGDFFLNNPISIPLLATTSILLLYHRYKDEWRQLFDQTPPENDPDPSAGKTPLLKISA